MFFIPLCHAFSLAFFFFFFASCFVVRYFKIRQTSDDVILLKALLDVDKRNICYACDALHISIMSDSNYRG